MPLRRVWWRCLSRHFRMAHVNGERDANLVAPGAPHVLVLLTVARVHPGDCGTVPCPPYCEQWVYVLSLHAMLCARTAVSAAGIRGG